MTNQASRKKRNGWLIALMAVILVIGIVLNTAAVMMKSTFDQFLGSGPRTVIQAGNLDGRYYEQKYETSEAARDAGYAVAERVNAEGSILLKNNGVLPLAADAEVVPLGYAFRSPIYGQSSPSGSAKWADEPVSPYNALNDSSLKLNPEIVNGVTKMRKTIVLTEAEGTRSATGGQSALGGDFPLTAFDPASYKKAPAAPDGTALVFIARGGQEGTDVKFDAYSDGTPHYLALTEAEKGMIAEAKRLCKNVVLIVNSSAPMELGPVVSGELECDAILWIAHPGNNGFAALPKLLTGEINPSGRTVDIWPADFTADPSYQAIGVHRYTNYTVTSGSLTDGGTFRPRLIRSWMPESGSKSPPRCWPPSARRARLPPVPARRSPSPSPGTISPPTPLIMTTATARRAATCWRREITPSPSAGTATRSWTARR